MSQVATALLALVAQQRQLLRSTWYAFYRRLSLPRRRHLKRRDAMTQLLVLLGLLLVLLGKHHDLSVFRVELRRERLHGAHELREERVHVEPEHGVHLLEHGRARTQALLRAVVRLGRVDERERRAPSRPRPG